VDPFTIRAKFTIMFWLLFSFSFDFFISFLAAMVIFFLINLAVFMGILGIADLDNSTIPEITFPIGLSWPGKEP